MTRPSSYRYDVAFSFLAKDVHLAEQLANDLQPALSTFVYSRRKEELLGGDGMDQFAAVFGGEARLAVILYRDGWGRTPWTAFEETHIKSRALATRMTSFLVIKLDDSELPLWIPDTHLYLSVANESRFELTAVIRLRARERGAILKSESPLDVATRLKREQDAKKRREERQSSSNAVDEVKVEVRKLFAEMVRLVNAVKAGEPAIDIDAATYEQQCGITSSKASISLRWTQRYTNTLNEARLRVNHWAGRIRLPRGAADDVGGGAWERAIHYTPELSHQDEWVWRYNSSLDDYGRDDDDGGFIFVDLSPGETYRSLELADHLVRRYLERVLGS